MKCGSRMVGSYEHETVKIVLTILLHIYLENVEFFYPDSLLF